MRNALNQSLIQAFFDHFNAHDSDAISMPVDGFSHVVADIGFIPPGKAVEKVQGYKARLKKYGFRSRMEVGNHFYMEKLGFANPIPAHFEQEDKGYQYLLLSGYDTLHHRHYVFALVTYLPDDDDAGVCICYLDIQNDAGGSQYWQDGEIYAQAQGYRALLPDSSYYENQLAWQALEPLVTALYLHLRNELPTELNVRIPQATREQPATREDLASFLRYAQVDETFIQQNLGAMFTLLQEKGAHNTQGQPEDNENSLYLEDVIRNHGNAVHADWKFDADELERHVQQLCRLNEFAWQPPPHAYGADLFPYIRQEIECYDLWLCNFNTGGDDYLFLLFPLEKMPEIMALAQRLHIPLQDFFQ